MCDESGKSNARGTSVAMACMQGKLVMPQVADARLQVRVGSEGSGTGGDGEGERWEK